jgi:hypothetical protein
LQSEFYEIQEVDRVEVLNYYTLSQLMQFMDIETPHEVFVNGARASADTKIYENFKVAWIDREEIYKAQRFVTEEVVEETEPSNEGASDEGEPNGDESAKGEQVKEGKSKKGVSKRDKSKELSEKIHNLDEEAQAEGQSSSGAVVDMNVMVNGENITLT